MTEGPDIRAPEAVRVACEHCGKQIREGAARCPHCQSAQGRTPVWRRPFALLATATALFSFVFSVEQLYGAWSERVELRRAISEELEAARVLAEAADYYSAWQAIERARTLNPTARDIGEAQIGIAASWMLQSGTPIGWVPRGREDESGNTPGQIANTVYPALITAALAAEGSERAELEGLVAWARYLRGRELLNRRDDIAGDLIDALEHDPQAYYPNLFLGFWRVAMLDEPRAADTPWDRALAAESARGRPGQVERIRLYTLETRIDQASRYPGENPESDREARAMYLAVLDDMRRSGQSARGWVKTESYLGVYLGPLSRVEFFDEVFPLLDVEDQLAIVDWLRESYDIQPERYSSLAERMMYIRGRLLERLGRTPEALSAVDATRTENLHSDLRDRMDETYERLTGQTPLPSDPWELAAYHLEHSPLDSEEVAAAFESLSQDWPYWRTHWSDALLAALDLAIARLEHAPPVDSDAAQLSEEERESYLIRFRHLRGAMRARAMESFNEGIAELEGLLLDPALDSTTRQRVLIDLTDAYAYAPRATRPEMVRSQPEADVTTAYLTEALDRLNAALDEGYSDWVRIELRFRILREHDAYNGLSLRHNRVPPREESDPD